MFFWSIVLILIGIYSSYIFGKSRIKKLVYSTNLKPKSQYNYHAQYVLSWCLLPALIVYFSWAVFEEQIIQNLILDSFEYVEGAAYDDGLLLAEIRNVANNIDFSDGKSQEIIIQPGSVIYVPRKIDDTISSRLTAQAYATILGNISLALASINSINK